MRVVIISWDGLEYALVKKHNCRNLMQKEYGKVNLEPYFQSRVSGVGGRIPLTPRIYALTITGMLPSDFEDYDKFTHDTDWEKILSRGIDDKYPSIFSLSDKSVAIELPSYNHTCKTFYAGKSWIDRFTGKPLFQRYWNNEISLEGTEKEYYKWMEIKASYLDLLLLFGYDLIFMYFKETDKLGHIYKNPTFDENKKRMYKKVDKLTGEMISQIPEDSLIIVHSDHGMGPNGGTHSPYGFWSSNRPLKRGHIIDLNDWFEIIKEWYGKPTKEEEKKKYDDPYTEEEKKKMMDHLRKLGYLE